MRLTEKGNVFSLFSLFFPEIKVILTLIHQITEALNKI